MAMLDQINVDVQRAFPDDERLRPERVQRQLVRVLFVWSLMGENVQVGYRQGMHEIAAICWLVYSEAVDRAAGEAHAEADIFVLFELVMARARPWFEWRDQKKVSADGPCCPALC
ncbi:hypothetical protein L7F22_040878 [Adiantum nelumboides]|nr:hypothetical protein [Adiantum nelumboides]